MNVTLRAANTADLDWLDPLYESLMRPHVERLRSTWDPFRFRQTFRPELVSIIQVDHEDAGLLKVEPRPDCLYLADIQLAPPYQSRGIGSRLVREVCQRAARQGLPVRLRVLKGNPAKALYHRLGFQEIEARPDSHILEWTAAGA